MKKLYILFFIFLIIAFSLTLGCLRKPASLGSDCDIRVLADSTIWKSAEAPLREIFEKVEYTPQREVVFNILKGEPDNYKRFKNLIFLSTLDATDKISQSVNSSLSENALAEVKSGNIIFVQKTQWAQDQIIMFLIGKDLPTLLTRIDEQQSEIFFQFNDHWNKFHEKILFGYKEQVDIEKHLLNTYGWSIRVPIDYKLEKQSAKDRFVMFRRNIPPRWFAVYWMDAADPNIITKDWCIQHRNEIGKTFYNNEVVEEKWEEVKSEEVIFQNRRALKLKGLWKTPDDSPDPAGGPFRMYCFYDEPMERIYFIDFHLFSPSLKKRKLHYLRQMEILANTFKTKLENHM